MLFGALLVFAPGAGANGPGNVFQGVCTPTDASSGTCVVDEPMGNNVATHGTATYSRTGDTMTFTINLSDAGATISQIQACMAVATGPTNPYVPTEANTCAGSSADRVLDVSRGSVQNPFTIDLNSVPDFEAGDDVYFALHINTSGLTTYIVGSGGSPVDVCPEMDGVQTSTSQCPPRPTCVELGNCPTPPPPPPAGIDDATLTIATVVTGDELDEWTFGFDGDLDAFVLTHDVDTKTFEELAPGEYTVTETDAGLATFDDIECDDDASVVIDLDDASVTVDLSEGDDVTCTFVNGYELEILPEETPPTAETPPAKAPQAKAPAAKTVTPEAEVLGETVTRTLPRTGSSSTGMLATAGIALMLFGAALVGGSRRLQTVR